MQNLHSILPVVMILSAVQIAEATTNTVTSPEGPTILVYNSSTLPASFVLDGRTSIIVVPGKGEVLKTRQGDHIISCHLGRIAKCQGISDKLSVNADNQTLLKISGAMLDLAGALKLVATHVVSIYLNGSSSAPMWTADCNTYFPASGDVGASVGEQLLLSTSAPFVPSTAQNCPYHSYIPILYRGTLRLIEAYSVSFKYKPSSSVNAIPLNISDRF